MQSGSSRPEYKVRGSRTLAYPVAGFVAANALDKKGGKNGQ